MDERVARDTLSHASYAKFRSFRSAAAVNNVPAKSPMSMTFIRCRVRRLHASVAICDGRIEIKFNDTRRLSAVRRSLLFAQILIDYPRNGVSFFVLGFGVPRKMKVEPNEVTDLVIQTRKFHAKTKPTLNVNCLQNLTVNRKFTQFVTHL